MWRGRTGQNELPSVNCETKKKRNQEGDYCGKICQDGPPSENCEARREAIKMAKNPIGNHKGLGIGHSGMTCQNGPPSEELSNVPNCEAEIIKIKRRLSEEPMKSGEELQSQQSKMAKNPTGNHKGLGTCRQECGGPDKELHCLKCQKVITVSIEF